MSVMLDRLRRFRPVGTPGAAGPVGVPVDSRTGVPTELVGVFAALDDVIAECDEIRTRAEQAAAELVTAAQREASTTIAEAVARAPAERAGVAAAIRASGDSTADQTRAAANAEADLVLRRGRQRMDELVALILDKLDADADAGRAGVA